ncbi:M20 family metallopeptidase [Bacilliculturomica massiliensis]|uniref:M20 family metallopeptidase n=1 Tax=Bacilliculturomica massiliensis TaxID=1917867 RepID=UPI00102F7F7F|nr:M20 family metallopeptidase [Bacilliculturomica massiliensis]
MRKRIRESVDRNYEKVAAVCRDIYENPEIALQEVHASAVLKDLLGGEGFEVEENCAGLPTAFKAAKKNGPGPRVAIMAEYDALPEIGHACGHHLIAGMSLLAGIGLAECLEEYQGEVAVFGTPAEETGDGKAQMAKAGCFDGYDIGIMLHPFYGNCVAPRISAIGVYDFTFIGKESHAGAAPFEGINALDAVVTMYDSVSMMRQQLKDGTRIGAIVLAGGTVSNSIPDKCSIRYEVRSLDMDYYHQVVEQVRRCAQAAALATGCEMEWIQSAPTCASLVPSPVLVREFETLMREFNMDEEQESVDMGSTDLGEVNQIIPTIHPLVKMVENGEKAHTVEFLKAANAPYAWKKMKEYGELLACLGLRIFEDPQVLRELREEREQKRRRNVQENKG